MKRRGLNFVTDQHEMNLDEDCIEKMEQETDNIAPKIIAILGLSDNCDTAVLKEQLIEYCESYRESLIGGKKKKNTNDSEINEEVKSAIRAYLCPPAGSSNNLGSKK